jgi:hypothetical protein
LSVYIIKLHFNGYSCNKELSLEFNYSITRATVILVYIKAPQCDYYLTPYYYVPFRDECKRVTVTCLIPLPDITIKCEIFVLFEHKLPPRLATERSRSVLFMLIRYAHVFTLANQLSASFSITCISC